MGWAGPVAGGQRGGLETEPRRRGLSGLVGAARMWAQ